MEYNLHGQELTFLLLGSLPRKPALQIFWDFKTKGWRPPSIIDGFIMKMDCSIFMGTVREAHVIGGPIETGCSSYRHVDSYSMQSVESFLAHELMLHFFNVFCEVPESG